MPPLTRFVIVRALALAAVVWFGVGFAREMWRTVDRQVLHPPQESDPMVWHFGTPPPMRFRNFVARARNEMPAGARVAFASSADPNERATFFRYLWASYFLAEYDVIPAEYSGPENPDFWLTWNIVPQARVMPVFESPEGSLYRVER